MIYIDKTWIPTDKMIRIRSTTDQCYGKSGHIRLRLCDSGGNNGCTFMTRELVRLGNNLDLTFKCLRDCYLDVTSFDGGNYTCGALTCKKMCEGDSYSVGFDGKTFQIKVLP